jgi:hypothetical protein
MTNAGLGPRRGRAESNDDERPDRRALIAFHGCRAGRSGAGSSLEVDPIGFEPTTSAMQGQRSARLSYGPARRSTAAAGAGYVTG